MSKIKNKTHKLWTEKYRPQNVDQYIFHDTHLKAAVYRMIADRSIPHLLFSGTAGAGKTSLAQILIRALNIDETDVLTINASDEKGIDTFRDKVKTFSTSVALGPFKIIHLEEADMLTPAAQAALKMFMEDMNEHVRFMLTCNTVSKIIVPIRSRCQEFFFKAADYDDVVESMVNILASERVTFDLTLLDKYVTYGYPDIRKVINMLQQNTVNGELLPPNIAGESGDYKFKLVDLVEADKWNDARKLVCSSVADDEWESVYRFMYENLVRAPKFQDASKWEEAIIIVAEHLYKHSIVADPEINAAAMFIRLGQV